MYHREPCDQVVGAAIAADPEEVVQTAVPRVAAHDRLVGIRAVERRVKAGDLRKLRRPFQQLGNGDTLCG